MHRFLFGLVLPLLLAFGDRPAPTQGVFEVHFAGSRRPASSANPAVQLVWGTAQGPDDAPFYRALVLSSDDQGKTWRQALPLQDGSELLALVPIPSGWLAVVGWTVEGPGELNLFQSGDGGRSFQRVGAIPKPHNLDALEVLHFADASNGCIALRDPDSADGPGTRSVLTTSDGGAHWSHRSGASCPVDKPESSSPAPATPRPPKRWRRNGNIWRPIKAQRLRENHLDRVLLSA